VTSASIPERPLAGPTGTTGPELRLNGWRDPAILVTAAIAGTAGFAQFGASSALADVARSFGQPTGVGTTVAAQIGLSATVLGVGLGIIRLAALASLPLAGLADRLGRRRVMLACTTLGLACSAAAALSPGYWWFVALFALGRPLLATTNTVSGVIAAEETRSSDRTKAIALVTAGWGAGTGAIAVLRGVAGDALSWRGLFSLVVIPILAMPLLGRRLREPDRFQRLRRGGGATPGTHHRILGRPPPELRSRLWLMTVLIGLLGLVTGPANAMVFVYAESVLGLPRLATAGMVAAAGLLGLVGLVAGRWAADRLGRRLTAGVTQAAIAVAAIVTYSGTPAAVIGGYLLAIFVTSVFAPATGAMAAELFPTSVRATVAGWMGVAGILGAVAGLVLFGILVTGSNSFLMAAVVVALPVLALSALYGRLPETVGMELEESAPD
jgi:MFS family permease